MENSLHPDAPQPPHVPDHTLLRLVGRGSYGEVWLAQNIMGAGRAVKVVRRTAFQSARPFEREYSAIRRFEPLSRQADGLIHVLHVGRHDDAGLFYYVMELADPVVPGGAELDVAGYAPRTLAGEFARTGRLPLADCLGVACSLAQALGALHQKGLVHRDVKPSNIIYVNGRTKLADIGLLSEQGESRSFVGTEGYIPPEGPGAPGADVFSLGKVLYQACTGLEHTRYPELPAAWIARDEHGAMEFFEIVLRACEGDAARRYANAGELQGDLALLQSGRSVRRVRQLERRVLALRRWGVAAAALAALAWGGTWMASQRAAREAALRAAAEDALFASQLQLAGEAVRSTRPAARAEALAAVKAAAQIKPGRRELRDVTVAALVQPGLREIRRIPFTPGPEGQPTGMPAFDASLQTFTLVDAQGRITMHRTADGSTTTALPQSLPPAWLHLMLSPDGRWLAAPAEAGRLQLLRTDGSGPAILLGGLPGGGPARFSPDGSRLIVPAPSGDAHLYAIGGPDFGATSPLQPLATLQLAAKDELAGTVGSVNAVFSPDGRRVAAGFSINREAGAAGLVTVHDVATGERTAAMPTDAPVNALAWHPGGAWIALAMADTQVRRWRPGEASAAAWVRQEAQAVAVEFHPGGEMAITSGWDSTTLLWNVADGGLITRLPGWGLDARFSTDGRRLVASDANRRESRLYEIERLPLCQQIILPRSPQVAPWTTGPEAVAVSPEGWLAIGAAEGFWLARPGSPEVFETRHGGIHSLTSSGGRLCIGSAGALAQMPFPRLESGGRWQVGDPEILVDNHNFLGAAFAKNGSRAFACTSENVYSWREGSPETRTFPGLPMRYMAASADGSWVACATRGKGFVRVWPADDPGRARDIPASGAWIRTAMAPDASFVLVGDGYAVRAIRLPGLEPAWTAPGREPGSLSATCEVSPGGHLVAAALEPNVPWLLDAATGRPIVRLAHPFGQNVSALAFSEDERWLAVCGSRWTVFLWDLHALRQQLAAQGLDW